MAADVVWLCYERCKKLPRAKAAIGGTKEMIVESLWYEASPYFYAVTGLASVWSIDSLLALTSGTLLVTSACTILARRRSYRRAVAEHRRKYSPSRSRE
jgi:hypothetical protein